MKQQAIDLHKQGFLKREIAEQLNIGYSTVKLYTKGLPTVRPNSKFVCRDCKDTNTENFFPGTPYYCKTCWNQRTYKKQKETVLDYMLSRGGARCQQCGYDRCIGALEFHHRNPTEKDPSWNRGWKIDKLKIELDKCDILCANCHREVHAEMRKGNELQ